MVFPLKISLLNYLIYSFLYYIVLSAFSES